MSRPEGIKNKKVLDEEADSESTFLRYVLDGHDFWKKKSESMRQAGKDPAKENEYALAFKLLINQFTVVENPNT